ncbi:uncharacterized protein LOC131656662 isoform X1 [Vicia villosa]|uniref:uncharacterized protein LOC131656662 isoform X1 n=1 Tax=Vicia villosa TaxID=3911 RepID=UPI00273B9BA5|nr:uncharacterized protein LOC131656662 isoform X1 [Vicia villosa]
MAPNLFPLRVAQSYHDHEATEFRELVMEDKWEEVIAKYNEHIKYHKIEIKGRGTALHVAVSNGLKKEVKSLVEAIEKLGDESSLKMKNEIGGTPLHLAAYRGFTDVCEVIIGKEGERKYLIQEKNGKGETPLFWAVRARKRLVFVYLQQFFPYDINIAVNNNDTSILHVAIQREMFDLANIIMHCYESLGSMKDKDDVTPLEILATRTSAFMSGSRRLSWWKQILYFCFSVSLQDAKTTMELYQKKAISKGNLKNDKDYHSEVLIPVYRVDELEKAYKVSNTLAQLDFFSCGKILCHRIQKFVSRWPILSLLDIKTIKTIKKKHIFGRLLLEEFMKNPYESYMGGGLDPLRDIEHEEKREDWFVNVPKFIKHEQEGDTSMQKTLENKKLEDSTFLAVAKSGIAEIMEELNSKVPNTYDKKGLLLVAMKNIKPELSEEKSILKETAYLIAASHGIVEMMSALKQKIRSVTHEINSNNENALLLAVKNRQPHVIKWLWKSLPREVFQHLNLEVDKNENTVLHLAAYTSIQRENTWKISGAAMQMMWDIKWYKYIKGLVPEHFNHRNNKEGKTPSEIFKEQHKELLQNSIEWLKDTSESCSVVAALIAGVSFATSGSVPGGNQATGKPALEGQPAFEGFAISSLIGLYFSVTALIMFLSILTSRKEVEDFRRNLPMKLLFGLSSLFVSIVAMFVSFCAGHFLVLTDKYTKGGILFYLYISICLPVAFYAAVQFPLFLDLVKVIWKKVPPPSVKGVHL